MTFSDASITRVLDLYWKKKLQSSHQKQIKNFLHTNQAIGYEECCVDSGDQRGVKLKAGSDISYMFCVLYYALHCLCIIHRERMCFVCSVAVVTVTVLWASGWSLWVANDDRVVFCETTCLKISAYNKKKALSAADLLWYMWMKTVEIKRTWQQHSFQNGRANLELL
jgi:hypothetical protein